MGKDTKVELLSYSQNHIDTCVRLEEGDQWVRITGIYGVPEVNQRYHT